MSDDPVQNNRQTPGVAIAALYLGIGSLVVLVASVLLGWFVESIGIVNFMGVVYLLALLAVVCGIIALKKTGAEKQAGKKAAIAGIIMGAAAVILALGIQVAVFILFIPWLGA